MDHNSTTSYVHNLAGAMRRRFRTAPASSSMSMRSIIAGEYDQSAVQNKSKKLSESFGLPITGQDSSITSLLKPSHDLLMSKEFEFKGKAHSKKEGIFHQFNYEHSNGTKVRTFINPHSENAQIQHHVNNQWVHKDGLEKALSSKTEDFVDSYNDHSLDYDPNSPEPRYLQLAKAAIMARKDMRCRDCGFVGLPGPDKMCPECSGGMEMPQIGAQQEQMSTADIKGAIRRAIQKRSAIAPGPLPV